MIFSGRAIPQSYRAPCLSALFSFPPHGVFGSLRSRPAARFRSVAAQQRRDEEHHAQRNRFAAIEPQISYFPADLGNDRARNDRQQRRARRNADRQNAQAHHLLRARKREGRAVGQLIGEIDLRELRQHRLARRENQTRRSGRIDRSDARLGALLENPLQRKATDAQRFRAERKADDRGDAAAKRDDAADENDFAQNFSDL